MIKKTTESPTKLKPQSVLVPKQQFPGLPIFLVEINKPIKTK